MDIFVVNLPLNSRTVRRGPIRPLLLLNHAMKPTWNVPLSGHCSALILSERLLLQSILVSWLPSCPYFWNLSIKDAWLHVDVAESLSQKIYRLTIYWFLWILLSVWSLILMEIRQTCQVFIRISISCPFCNGICFCQRSVCVVMLRLHLGILG